MKKLFWMMLAALPMQAMAKENDPIAYKCYYCTPAEMEDVALAQGVGRHYVYDASKPHIAGFDVVTVGGKLTAQSFEAEAWIQRQFRGMIGIYHLTDGTMKAWVKGVALSAPGTEHGRTPRLLWGHHLSSLHPDHIAARETVHRFLSETPQLRFLDTSDSGGRLLMFAHMLENDDPIIANLNFGPYPEFDGDGLLARFFFDHATRRWNYIDAEDRDHPIQEGRDDFAPAEGITQFDYRYTYSQYRNAFIDRARWASIPVHGELPNHGIQKVRCERKADDIQCYIEK